MNMPMQCQEGLVLLNHLLHGFRPDGNHDGASAADYRVQLFVKEWRVVKFRLEGWRVEVEYGVLLVLHLGNVLLQSLLKPVFLLLTCGFPWTRVHPSAAGHLM